MDDDAFDAMFPPEVRAVSGRFWTPQSVARRAAEIISDVGVTSVLDVGSGPGKFCLAAGSIARHVAFVGVEQRAHLVEVARDVAAKMRVKNAQFLVGDATRVELDDFDALYFFNPFAENGFAHGDHYDTTVELSMRRLTDDVARVERLLASTRPGTLAFTYHTFGGRFPTSFELFHCERAGTDWLRVWRKTEARAVPGRSWFEDDFCQLVVAEATRARTGAQVAERSLRDGDEEARLPSETPAKGA